jgi:uncharacterized protein (TIGR03545 family)
MSNQTPEKKDNKEKKVKKKGPIRFEAIVPVGIIVALLVAYFTILFDSNLKMGLEFAGTYIHGAEVNIGSVKTSFTEPSFEIRDIQITDKNKPARNIIQVGRIKLALLWDALLRVKVVVPEAAIENIQALTPRKKPGRVIPKSEGSNEPGALAKVEGAVIEQTKADYEGNVLGDIANLLGGTDPADQLKKIESELKASGKIKELEGVLKEKEKEWRTRLASLPTDKDFKAMESRFKALKFDSKNPVQFANDLKEAQNLLKEADQKVKLVSQTGKDLDGDLKTTDQSFKEIEKMIQQDIKDIQTRLNIPSIDGGEFAKKMFGKMIAEKIAAYAKYIELARQYMPPKKAAGEKTAAREEVVPRARGEGRNVRFPITKGYPTFWLQKAKISSEVSSSNEYSGNISGLVTNFSSAPEVVRDPARIEVRGDFPKQQIQGFSLDAELDHRTELPKQTVRLAITSYPVGGQELSNSEDVTFNITDSQGQLEFQAVNQTTGVNMKVVNFFNAVKYEVNAKNAIVLDVLNGVAADVTKVSVQAEAKGPWSNLDWHIKSNIADAITGAFKKQIEIKIAEAKAKIEKLVNEKIAAEKQKLEAEFKKLKGEVDKVIAEKTAEVEKAKAQVNSEIDKKKKEGAAPLKDIKKEGKKLLKGLGL